MHDFFALFILPGSLTLDFMRPFNGLGVYSKNQILWGRKLMKKAFQMGLAALMVTMLGMAMPVKADDIHRGLISYWPLDVVDGTTTPDVAVGNDLELYGMDAGNLMPGKFGQAMSFDGVEEYLAIQHNGANGLPVANRPSFSISLWVNGDGVAQQDKRVFSEGSTQQNNTLFNIGTDNNADAGLRTGSVDILIRNDIGTSLVNHTKSEGTAFDGTWHHIAWVQDNGYARIYIDGALDPIEFNVDQQPFNPEILSIGAIVRAGTCCFYNGLVDEVAVWSRALSPEEVQSLANGSIALPIQEFAPEITVQPEGASLNIGDQYTAEVFVSGRVPISYQWKRDGAAITGETGSTLTFTNVTTDDTGFYSVEVTNAQGTVESEEFRILVNPDPEPNVSEGLVSYWPFDEVEDQGGGFWTTPDIYSNNDMTLMLMDDFSLVDSPNNKALYFDGLSQYAYRQGGFAISENEIYSISFWVKGEGIGQNDFRVFSEASTETNTPLFNFGTHNGETQLLKVFIRNDDNTAPVNRLSTTPVFDDTWHHVVWVDNNGDAKLYIDGLLDSTDFSYTRGPRSANTTSVGAILRAGPSHWFTGEIDEVAVWNRIITFSEIQEVMESGIDEPTEPIAPEVVIQPVGVELWEGSTYSLSVQATGTSPLTYQWSKDGTPIDGANSSTLVFYSLTPSDSGLYSVVVSNSSGSDTSETAEMLVKDVKNITTGMIAYWPFEDVGETTPDLVYGNDMTLVNMGPENQVPGQFGQAISLDGVEEHLEYFHDAETVGLPVYSHPYYSVAFWVKGMGIDQSDRRVFSEASTLTTTPLFNIGTDNTGASGSVDLYFRNDDNSNPLNHVHSGGAAFDDEWHHVVVTDAEGELTLYIDGVQDSTFSYSRGEFTPIPPRSARSAARRPVTGLAGSSMRWLPGSGYCR
jgi:hypothetical protein